MSRAFIADVLRDSADLTQTAAKKAANELVEAITHALKKEGKFTVPGFGTFAVRSTKARKGLNPRTGEVIKIAAGRTVRFKPSKLLKSGV